ncbi:MAG: hypothetical protein FP826_10580 [Sphingomonadales bacterium]|nr:hypothetical protein [Sphingomonadales bacterium]MBU3993273.1 hypothetical protein [Alphaproteobacteria bacterium]
MKLVERRRGQVRVSESGGVRLPDRQTDGEEDDERVLIKLPRLAYQAARVIRVEDGRAGLEFDTLLHSAVLAHLQQAVG